MSQKPPANRMSLQTFKGKLVGAKKGFKLLKQKRDALKARFQAMLKEIVATKLEAGQSLKDANFSYAKANWASTGEDISSTVLERASKPSITCKTAADNVAGVKLPVFKMTHDPAKDQVMQTLGVTQGGAVINTCRETYFQAVQALIKLASLQTAFRTLDNEIQMTSRRVNALEYVIIPRIEAIIAEIITELDEQARDDFIRIKKVVQKKREKKAREALDLAAEEAVAAEKANPTPAQAAAPPMGSLPGSRIMPPGQLPPQMSAVQAPGPSKDLVF
jgi:V-type H+-transporting ATPase subunit D